MNLLIYCYGPISISKNNFCKAFAKANKDIGLIEMHKLRKKIIGSLVPSEGVDEKPLVKELQNKVRQLFSKKKNVLINGLLLNKASRSSLLNEINKIDANTKKVAVCFSGEAVDLFEENKKDKDLKILQFDTIRSQVNALKKAGDDESIDLLINEISHEKDGFNLKTKLWGEERIIFCSDYKKMLDFFNFSKSE